ncbi:hypothetical protein CRV24_008914 [Beauveria bassiana]|nr:hypothetical protein CRV24_008914 [Beauveria bassiana]
MSRCLDPMAGNARNDKNGALRQGREPSPSETDIRTNDIALSSRRARHKASAAPTSNLAHLSSRILKKRVDQLYQILIPISPFNSGSIGKFVTRQGLASATYASASSKPSCHRQRDRQAMRRIMMVATRGFLYLATVFANALTASQGGRLISDVIETGSGVALGVLTSPQRWLRRSPS